MIREAICEGMDVEEALEKAKAELGLAETDEYDFEVLQREEKKKFGLFGGRLAKVRAFVVIKEAPEDKTEHFLREVLDKMGLVGIQIEKNIGEDSVEFNLSGEEEGVVIGRRGETLDALQYLTSLVANHNNDEYVKISLNVGNYRDKREKTLEILGRKLAFKAIKTGRKTSLEPMNPYERRIIHTAVQKVNGAISWSEGENNARHVVIGPDPKVKNNRRGGYNNRRGGGRRGGYNNSQSRNTKPAPNPDRVPLNEGGTTGLYGRIDK